MALTSQTVAPSRGALVKANFSANVGYRALISLTLENGELIPFGAQIIFKDNPQLNNIVGNDGEVYLSGLSEKGQFIVKYNDKQCSATYNLLGVPHYLGLYKTTVVCHK